MKIQKSFDIEAPIDTVWNFVTNPDSIAPCIPGCSDVEQIDDSHFSARIGLAIGPIKASFKVMIEQLECKVPSFARYATTGAENGKASRLKADSSLALVAVSDNRTAVSYTSEVTIFGRLGKFGSGLVQKKADAIGEQFVQAMRERIERQ